ncbi:hypothetical protein SAMN05216188_119109 [Lentzea xinjiangensis]|uniref:NACHT domain-containing protein n=1 Tax=Lentzea xinjiangensis TaxID=402600 RepID=A0A1H9TVV9_9PSEU|nr:hypothetical protein [Lentzea xinjiangensis]SES01365.1 hypothetical protein SAMN05216188_119109 [Lentzea xinjiangensis]
MARDDLDFTTGDVSGTVFQANNVHGDVHLHVGKSARPAYDPPSTWAEARQPAPEIQSLLWAQIQAAHETPYRLPGARKPSLDTIYVRQDLGNAVDEPDEPDQARQDPVLDDEGRLIEAPVRPVVRFTVRPPSRTMAEALDGDAHLVVTGGPGLGKSTLTLRLAADIARYWSHRDDDAPLSEPVVPLKITARALAVRLGVPFAQALADSANAEYGSFLREPVDKDLFTGRVAGCRWLLLVDGLDEVADTDQRFRLVGALAAWAQDGTYRILLTTRPTEGGALAPLHRIGAVRYELQPFDAAALARFAANWFPEDDAQRFLRQIREAHLDELVQVPLLATIAAIIHGEYSAEPLPGNQYSLYETYLAHIRRDTPDRFDRERLLEHLARTRLETDTPLLAAARDWVAGRETPQSPAWQEDLTAYLLSVGPFVLRGGDLAFLHQSFAEHLAATSCARELPDEFCPDVFADLLHAADARESGRFARAVLLHHTRLHPGEADRLLDWLHRGNAGQHLLAARLLAHHLPASAPRTEAFLDTVRDWAMTTHYSAADILAEASRATRFPDLAAWLRCLLDCAEAPRWSRVEAATALAVRVRGPHTPEALSFLHHVVEDSRAQVSDRLMAAEALAQCGAGEREVAECGLRAVLTDPNASGASIRAAAVILAAFDGDARAFAVDALSAALADDDASPLRIVEAATGLLEIDPASADVCAEFFLSVLRNPANTALGWYDAAMGLASIGPDRLDEAVVELIARITERLRTPGRQVAAARALRELGLQHRQTAGELIAAAAGFAVGGLNRSLLLGHLVTYASQRDTALAGLRKLMAECHQNWNTIRRAAVALGKAGPSFRDETAAALSNSGAPVGSHDNVTILDALVDLGEPYRAQALRELHGLLADPDVHVEVRCRAANTLIRSGPDHHPQVIRHLRRIATPDAYQELARTCAGDEALAALLDCALSPDAPDDAMSLLANAVSGQDAVRAEEAAEALRAAARDARRPMRIRITAANGLSSLGSRFDRESAVELSRIILGEPMINDFRYVALHHSGSGVGPRRELAKALLDVLADERTSALREWKAVAVLDELGHGGDHEVIAALQGLVDFPGLAGDERAAAAVLLASRLPHQLNRVADLVVAGAEITPLETLKRHVRDLRLFGTDVSDRFRARLTSADRKPMEVIGAATVLGESGELRKLVQDDLLQLSRRCWAYNCLALVEPAAVSEAVDYLRVVIHDADAPADERGMAALRLAHIDRATTATSASTLWRFAEAPSAPLDERAAVLMNLDLLLNPSPRRYEQAVTDILRRPEVTAKAWRMLISVLPRPVRTEMERTLLQDRSVPIKDRVPSADQWDDLPLRDEVVAAIREVIAAPEECPRERADAAAALSSVSSTYQAEAVAALEQLPRNSARSGLAGMSRAHWWRVHDEALAEVADESLPFRLRYTAACLLDDIGAEPGAAAVEVLCSAPSWRQRLDGRLTSGKVDAVRRTRDDVDEPAVVRVRAAWKLRAYAVDDRAAGVRVLADVVGDRDARPALRLRALKYLGDFGVAGRKLAAPAAREMFSDVEVPVLARAGAAVVLHQVERSARREVLTFLTELVPQVAALRRVQVLSRIGQFDSTRAMLHLQEMGRSEPSPVVRMRCARTLVEMRRDQREQASVIARAVAWDETAPRHVRRGAARDLARWSELMREDARALLVRLRDCGAR